jgi:16S rRNA (uracil1498-N3)-methyltransferase
MAVSLRVAMPGSIRLFVPAALFAGAIVPATAAQAHYLGTVMRRAVGETVHLFNGRDGEWAARITRLQRNAADFGIEVQTASQDTGREADLWLAFALLKRDATDLIVQKATELGVAAIWPVTTARTNASRVNLDRLEAIAIEAAEQSERLTVPAIHEPRALSVLLDAWPPTRRLIVAVERSVAPPLAPMNEPACLVIGPEGGFTPAELDALRVHPLVTLASLGPLILRAETAAIAGLARLQGASRG